ncbi:MAG: alkaline phosphatase family protein [Chloroflexi bacterium]|nr:alkaline phosphatase family protein [Chloroflexota bacterium]
MTVGIIFLCFLLTGCISTPNLWGAAPALIIPETPAAVETVTASPTQTATLTPPTATLLPPLTVAAASAEIFVPEPTDTPPPQAIQRVLIISYDGMRPDAIAAAPMNNLLELIKTSAYTLTNARTIDYPATSPSHASMLSGLCMEKHGVIYNKYFKYMGYSGGVDIFDLAHSAGMKTVMIVSKDKLRQMAEPETTDIFEIRYGEPAVAREAVAQIAQGFDLMFVHFAGADLRGHKYGWMSGPQFTVLRQGDAALGKILNALDENNLRSSTLIIITADHGGHDKGHVGLIIEDFRIPWIASGPGIQPVEITAALQIMDTAATAAYALGLPQQPDWDGIPVYEAFGEPRIKTHPGKVCK